MQSPDPPHWARQLCELGGPELALRPSAFFTARIEAYPSLFPAPRKRGYARFTQGLWITCGDAADPPRGNRFANTVPTQAVSARRPKFKLCLISLVSAEGLEPSTP